jgi:hypothetical protein
MKSMIAGIGVVAVMLISAPAVRTQGGGHVGAMHVPIEPAAVKGAPYVAEVVTETVQPLPDGNRIVRKTTGRVYRDGQGRVRREEDREPGVVGRISISDPVAGFAWSLETESKVAWKTPYSAAGALALKFKETSPDPLDVERQRMVEHKIRDAGLPHRTQGEQWAERVEKLGSRQMEGVMAEGTRTTRTIAAGSIGNELPILVVTEYWRSPDLKVLVLTRSADPRMGETTHRLVGIARGEPDASWFTVPADYTVRETGIRHEAPRQ